MTHNEKRGSVLREAQISLFTGSLYGATHTFTGHPLDTIKSKMQLQEGYSDLNAIKTAKRIFRTEGLLGFFRGCVPPLWGSMMYRGIMMSAYEASYTYFDQNYSDESRIKQEVCFGLRPVVPISTVICSIARCFFESPIEYAKVMRQTGRNWTIQHIYRGFWWQVIRTTAMLLPIFSVVDIFRRKTQVLNSLGGNFLVTAGACGGAYFFCWPLETLKNMAQSGTPFPGASLKQKLVFLGGPMGLFRGVWPGTICGAVRNGFAMVALVYAHEWASILGLRQ